MDSLDSIILAYQAGQYDPFLSILRALIALIGGLAATWFLASLGSEVHVEESRRRQKSLVNYYETISKELWYRFGNSIDCYVRATFSASALVLSFWLILVARDTSLSGLGFIALMEGCLIALIAMYQLLKAGYIAKYKIVCSSFFVVALFIFFLISTASRLLYLYIDNEFFRTLSLILSAVAPFFFPFIAKETIVQYRTAVFARELRVAKPLANNKKIRETARAFSLESLEGSDAQRAGLLATVLRAIPLVAALVSLELLVSPLLLEFVVLTTEDKDDSSQEISRNITGGFVVVRHFNGDGSLAYEEKYEWLEAPNKLAVYRTKDGKFISHGEQTRLPGSAIYEQYDENGQLMSSSVFGDEDRIKETTFYDQDGRVSLVRLYQFDEDGKLTERCEKNAIGKVISRTWSIAAGEAKEDEYGIPFERGEHLNEDGQVTSLEFSYYDESDSGAYRTVLRDASSLTPLSVMHYDEKGDLIMQEIYEGGLIVGSSVYDTSFGNKIEETLFGPTGTRTRVAKWDSASGLPISVVNYAPSGEIISSELYERGKTIKRELDADGNTVKIVLCAE